MATFRSIKRTTRTVAAGTGSWLIVAPAAGDGGAPVAGDIIIVVIRQNTNATALSQVTTGITLQAQTNPGVGRATCYTGKAVGGETGWTFTVNAADAITADVLLYSGADPVTWLDVAVASGSEVTSDNSCDYPSVTPATSSTHLVLLGTARQGGGQTFGTPSGTTNRSQSASPFAGLVATFDVAVTGTSPTGTKTSTMSGSVDYKATFSVLLRNATSGVTGSKATETDTAFAGTPSVYVQGSKAIETDSAMPGFSGDFSHTQWGSHTRWAAHVRWDGLVPAVVADDSSGWGQVV